MKFNIGDTVIGNDMADRKYLITKKGYIGRVLKVRFNDEDDIQISTPDEQSGWWVCSKHFDMYQPAMTVSDDDRKRINDLLL